jgi:hypothetical protein
VLRSCVATRPFLGLGFVEESTRGIHQGWKGNVLSDKAAYRAATEPSLVIIINHLAKGDGPYMAQRVQTLPQKEMVEYEKHA